MGDAEREAAERRDAGAEDEQLTEAEDDLDPAEGELVALGAWLNLILLDEEADRATPGDKYRLKALVFSGEEDIEKFI